MAFVGKATPYMYKAYAVPAPQVQIYSGMTGLPWAMKPIIGLVSDMFPLFGYNKAPYMILTSFMGGAALLCLGIMPPFALGVMMFVMCLLMSEAQTSTCDLLSEAKYAEKMKESPAHGPKIVTFVWFGLTVGGLVATLVSGPVLDQYGPHFMFMIGGLPAIAVVIIVMMGYMQETCQTSEQIAAIRQRYYQQKEACALCLLMLIGTICIIVTTIISRDPLINCIVAVIVAVVMLVAFSVVLNPVIARANAFALIQTALGFSTGGASFYFYTDTPEQYPEGPHFSMFFYNSVLGVVGSLVSLLGIYCYQRYMTTWKYRDLIIATNIVLSLFAAVDVMMFARINVQYGIPDHLLVLGLSCFETLIFQWQWMPQVVILSYLCPRGMEATMYALLAGCHNLGNTISSNCGALLLEYFEVQPSGVDGESAQFENLWKAAAISTILPFFAVMVLIQLLPDARQNERLVSDEVTEATAGSLWKRWTSSD